MALLHQFMIALLALAVAGSAAAAGEIEKKPFGKTPDEREADLYIMRNAAGAEARITNFGAIAVGMRVPDRAGKLGDVLLSYNSPEEYLKKNSSCGAVIGRFANRIAGARFTLNGKEYTLAKNNGPNHIHGGLLGFNKVLWEGAPKPAEKNPAVELTYVSKDGEEGYPGTMTVKARYTLTEANELRLEITATTDKDTVVNMTNHAYFNLNGPGEGNVRDYVLQINASKFLPTDAGLIPTGELRPVDGTPFDFRKPVKVGEKLDPNDEQLKTGGGYDHTFVIDKPAGELGLMARVVNPVNGRVLEVESTAPGVQFFTAGVLKWENDPTSDTARQRRGAFCLEPQNFPDAPNKPNFPSAVLKAGDTYKHTIVFRFMVEK